MKTVSDFCEPRAQGCMSCQRGVMLTLLYTEIQTVTFGRMNTNNTHLSKQIGENLVSCKSAILLIRPSGMTPSNICEVRKFPASSQDLCTYMYLLALMSYGSGPSASNSVERSSTAMFAKLICLLVVT
jgi:hypothetical protein